MTISKAISRVTVSKIPEAIVVDQTHDISNIVHGMHANDGEQQQCFKQLRKTQWCRRAFGAIAVTVYFKFRGVLINQLLEGS